MIRLIREIAETVRMANQIAAQDDDGPRWSWFLTNRSFIAQVFALIFAVLAKFGVPLPISADMAADSVYGMVMSVMFLWAGVERLMGRTRVVWSKAQAYHALSEADALAAALRDAGALETAGQ